MLFPSFSVLLPLFWQAGGGGNTLPLMCRQWHTIASQVLPEKHTISRLPPPFPFFAEPSVYAMAQPSEDKNRQLFNYIIPVDTPFEFIWDGASLRTVVCMGVTNDLPWCALVPGPLSLVVSDETLCSHTNYVTVCEIREMCNQFWVPL